MSISAKWLWISLAAFQCLSLIHATANDDEADDEADDDQAAIGCDALRGPTVTISGHIGRDAGLLAARLDWYDDGSTNGRRTCRLSVQNVEAKGAYRVRVTLPECAPGCAPTLTLKSRLHCGVLPLDTLNVADGAKNGEYQVPIWMYDDCRSGRNARSVVGKREWAGDDMQWLKRSAADDWVPMHDTSPFGYNKKFDAHTMNWLRKRAPAYPWMQKKPTWNAGGVNWLKKRAWNKANAEWLKRGWGNNADMAWLKRGWSSGDVQWLKRSEPMYKADLDMPGKRWDHGEIMDWLKKRSADEDPYAVLSDQSDKRAWENAHTEWIKRDIDGEHVHRILKRDTSEQLRLAAGDDASDEAGKRNWGASGMSWIKRGHGEPSKKNWGASGMSWIKREPGQDKRNWGASGMSWIKRDLDQDKRNWGASGMSWIKRDNDKVRYDVDNDDAKRNWGASGMSWIKRDQNQDKRNWGASGMSWIKREEVPDKKNWGASGMSWIKRNEVQDPKRNWGASGMSWIKRDGDPDVDGDSVDDDDSAVEEDVNADAAKRNWGASGMSWIKRQNPELDKKNWGASGMSWIKRAEGEANKRNWGASGMSWIKRHDPDPEKKNWGASGMSWIKREGNEPEKKNWGASGMSWIKRAEGEGNDNKRNWGASGMSWIKRDPDEDEKRNWGASGMSWIKRGPHEKDKKNWGASGMSWIKRDSRNSFQDKSNVPHAWKTLEEMINSKIVPPLHVRSWAKESDWLKRSDRYERHASEMKSSTHRKLNHSLTQASESHTGTDPETDREDKPQTDPEPAASPAAATPLPDSHSVTKAH